MIAAQPIRYESATADALKHPKACLISEAKDSVSWKHFEGGKIYELSPAPAIVVGCHVDSNAVNSNHATAGVPNI